MKYRDSEGVDMVFDHGRFMREYKIIKNEIFKVREQNKLSREGGNGRVNRVYGFPATVHHGVVEFLAALHKIFVPLLHVTFRDRL